MLWRGEWRGWGERRIKSKRIPSIFSDGSTGSFICLRRHIFMSHVIFMRIGCTLLTCDMYMYRLRHINDPVLPSLKMEGTLFFLTVHLRIILVGDQLDAQFLL
jgi:hypothetical protein